MKSDRAQRLSVALACIEGEWPHEDWPTPDDPYVSRVVHLAPPFRIPERVDALLLRSERPAASLSQLQVAQTSAEVPVIVISPCRDTDSVIEVFQAGAGYLVEGDYCCHTLSSAVTASARGYTYLSPIACAALREVTRRASASGQATERLRALLSPREREVIGLLATGLGAQEIGLRLQLSEKTVRNNLSAIYAKLDARGSTDAVLRWIGAISATPGGDANAGARGVAGSVIR
ncbi:response regulator transcription factor [Streptomyces sp. NPDC004539]|uniref:response regulator transcription factor n=1 Tax=Streptomyces sp. NPDC004539 TaxID=3154280 RepID=UPI0033A4561E